MASEPADRIADELRRDTILRLASSRDDPEALREAIRLYIQSGYDLGLAFGELSDFFCVDTPSIVEAAGFVGDNADRVVAVFDELHGAHVRSSGQSVPRPRPEKSQTQADPAFTRPCPYCGYDLTGVSEKCPECGRLPAARCIHCNYDLTGLTDKCPECGWIIDPEALKLTTLQRPAAPSPARLAIGLFSILALLFTLAVALGIIIVIILYATSPEPTKP